RQPPVRERAGWFDPPGGPACTSVNSHDHLSRQAADHADVVRTPFNLLKHIRPSCPYPSINTDGFAHVQKVFAETANA
ncbi:hypothetical protein, partial [Methylobacterium sp.]|uniref:hypothetical protein n=1 Tax=Methylobacterium sp. TaxID=409 RepID=UPI0025D89769